MDERGSVRGDREVTCDGRRHANLQEIENEQIKTQARSEHRRQTRMLPCHVEVFTQYFNMKMLV